MLQNHNIRSSIIEFEQIEQECIDKYSPVDVYKVKKQGQQQIQNKKKKKLFADSDDENGGDVEIDNRIRDEELL